MIRNTLKYPLANLKLSCLRLINYNMRTFSTYPEDDHPERIGNQDQGISRDRLNPTMDRGDRNQDRGGSDINRNDPNRQQSDRNNRMGKDRNVDDPTLDPNFIEPQA